MSHNCNKFIIRDGVFVRDFDGMYKHNEDPWEQSVTYQDDIATMAAFHFLTSVFSRMRIECKNIMDIGCADGYHAKHFIEIFPGTNVIGTDISPAIIDRAREKNNKLNQVIFDIDDCRILNPNYENMYDLVFSSKTLYYVGPEIDKVIGNIKKYLKKKGVLTFVYNQQKDSFSNQWLTYESLRKKLINSGFIEYIFVEIGRFSEETTAIGIFMLGEGEDV